MLDRKQFLQLIQKRMLHGVYLLEGTEENIKATMLQTLRHAVLPEGMEDLNETILENPDSAAIVAAAETIPFMAEQRLVIVKECSALARGEADEKLLNYLPHVPETTVLVFVQRGKADARKKLYKAIDKLGGVVSFQPLTDAELGDWVRQSFQKAGKECTGATASLLIFVSGKSTQQLRMEIEKLISYVGDRSLITDDDVNAVATRSPEYTVFLLVNAVVEGRDGKAFTLLKELLTAGEERIGILAMLLRQYRILQHIKIMQYEKQSQQQMQENLGLRGFALESNLRQARGLTGGQVKQGVELCLDTEYRIKSGQLNQEGALEACMIRLLSMKHPNRN